MYEQDYIMRLIREMIRTILKLIFHIDMKSLTEEMLEDLEGKPTLDVLRDMVDEGKINLETALFFYSYLNEKPDEFLEENHFRRDEIQEGLLEVVSKYGLGSIADTFLEQ